MKFLSEDRTVDYRGYSISSKLDEDSVRELVDLLIKDKKLFYAVDPNAMAMQAPFAFDVKGEKFAVIISSKFIRLEHLNKK